MTPHKAQQLIALPQHVRELVSERLNDAQNEAYAEGRKDEREEWLPVLEALRQLWEASEGRTDEEINARIHARAAIAKATGEAA